MGPEPTHRSGMRKSTGQRPSSGLAGFDQSVAVEGVPMPEAFLTANVSSRYPQTPHRRRTGIDRTLRSNGHDPGGTPRASLA